MKKIMIALENASSDVRLIDAGCELARALKGELRLLHVAPPEPDFVGYAPGPQSTRDQLAHDLCRSREQMQEAAAALTLQGVPTDSLMVQGSAAETIAEQVSDWEADLLIIGKHERGILKRTIQGSVQEHVLKRVQCPVLMMPVPDERATG